MYTDWTKKLKDEDKQRYEESVKRVRWVLDDLKLIFQDRLATLDRQEAGEKQFDNPNWAYKQAFQNGQRSAIESSIKLIDMDTQLTSSSKQNLTKG